MKTETINFTVRNKKALTILKMVCDNVKMIASDTSRPNFVIDRVGLSCKCVDNELILMDSFNGNTVWTVDLDDTVTDIHISNVRDWFLRAEHRKLYVVRTNWLASIMYLTGFQKSEITGELKPVFSEGEPKVYFTKERAESTAGKFSNSNITLFVE